MKKISFLLLLVLMSCSSNKVFVDFDSSVNTLNFKTYQFYEDVGKGLNELDIRRVEKSINSYLKQNGFQESENPDFYINFISNKSLSSNSNNIGIGIGGRRGGVSLSGGIPIGAKKVNEEFVIELVNAKSDKIFWEGTLVSKISERISAEKKEIHYNEVVTKILTEFYKQKKSSKN